MTECGRTKLIVWAAALLLGTRVVVAADTAASQPRMLIEADQLQQTLNKPNVRILDVRSQDDFAKGHVPGAVWVNLGDWKSLATSEGGLHDANAWAMQIGKLGIRTSSLVVVYGEELSDTARAWWLLKYVGLQNVAILNAGWPIWQTEDRPVETSSATIAKTVFQPDFQAHRLEEIAALKESINRGTVKVVDTRSEDEFTGKEVRGQRGGHIPGAVHLEWKELVAKDGRFKTSSQLRELFRQRGILPTETVVCY